MCVGNVRVCDCVCVCLCVCGKCGCSDVIGVCGCVYRCGFTYAPVSEKWCGARWVPCNHLCMYGGPSMGLGF